MLGRGQQLAAFGHHWSGAEQWWQGVPGFEVRRDDLAEATEAQVDEFLDAIAEMIDADPRRPSGRSCSTSPAAGGRRRQTTSPP